MNHISKVCLLIFICLNPFKLFGAVGNAGGGGSSSTTNDYSIIVTNGGNYSLTTLNGKTPGNFLTNVANASGISFSGLGTSTLTPALNFSIIVTNNGSYSFGTVNGKTPATLVTNISSSTLTVTGQGTSTLNVEGGSGAAALTNAANYFTTSSPNTFNSWSLFSGSVTNASTVINNGVVTVNQFQTNNMTLITSNIIMRGGMVFARSEKTVNYTNTINDYMISWKGTTVAAPTNFLATGLLNGRTYVIKDAQRSAATTNIVVKPLSSDTIGGATSYTLRLNGESITITYDGVSNWEIN